MTPFTNADLKRLKSYKPEENPDGIRLHCLDLQSLLARLEAAEAERDRLTEVMHWAQCVLTAWNVGALLQESLLHKKLREVMIQYRERKAAGK